MSCLTGELVSIIQVLSEAVPAVSALFCFPPSLWLKELVKAYTNYNQRKIILEGGWTGRGRTEMGLGWDAAAILTSKPGWACPEE